MRDKAVRGTCGYLLSFLAVLILLGCNGVDKDQIVEQVPVEGDLQDIELTQRQLPNCPESEPVYYGGTGNTIGLGLGECFFAGGTDNQYYIPPNSCLIKVNDAQYSVVSCDSGLAESCLTDLGNGNRVVNAEPCPSE